MSRDKGSPIISAFFEKIDEPVYLPIVTLRLDFAHDRADGYRTTLSGRTISGRPVGISCRLYVAWIALGATICSNIIVPLFKRQVRVTAIS